MTCCSEALHKKHSGAATLIAQIQRGVTEISTCLENAIPEVCLIQKK